MQNGCFNFIDMLDDLSTDDLCYLIFRADETYKARRILELPLSSKHETYLKSQENK